MLIRFALTIWRQFEIFLSMMNRWESETTARLVYRLRGLGMAVAARSERRNRSRFLEKVE